VLDNQFKYWYTVVMEPMIYKSGDKETLKSLKRQQDWGCGICFKDIENNGVVDHDHKSGYVRGALCNNCNMGLGFFKDTVDFLRYAANYISKHNEIYEEMKRTYAQIFYESTIRQFTAVEQEELDSPIFDCFRSNIDLERVRRNRIEAEAPGRPAGSTAASHGHPVPGPS
jgi:Recombination endonuclease VII